MRIKAFWILCRVLFAVMDVLLFSFAVEVLSLYDRMPCSILIPFDSICLRLAKVGGIIMDNSGKRRRFWRVLAILGVAMMVPVSYLAGWMADVGQVRPVLSQLDAAQKALAHQQASIPQEPPEKAPSRLSLTWGARHVTVKWPAVKGAAAYVVYRAQGSQSYPQAIEVGQVSHVAVSISFVDASVKPNTSYTYWVVPVNAAGQGPVSPAATCRTYLPISAAVALAQRSAVVTRATNWEQSAWGLLASRQQSTQPLAWHVNAQWYSDYVFPSSATSSTWLTKRWTTWTVDGQALHVLPQKGISQLIGKFPVASALSVGDSTPQDIALWFRGGRWFDQLVDAQDPEIPPSALLMNRYAQAVAFTTASGQEVSFVAP